MKLAETNPIPESRIANKAEAAEFFQVSIPTIDAWIRRGAPYIQKGGRGVSWMIDLLEVATWRFGGGSADADEPESMSPKERLDWYKGNREKRLDQLEAGEVVKAEEARTAMATLLKQTMLTLDTLTEVAERQASLTPDQAQAVESIIDRERRTLHAKLLEKSKLSA